MITINKIHVENFKSIRSLDLELAPLNVLVGPNNAGKSNILDVFGFEGDLVREAKNAFQARGGFARIAWGGDPDHEISLEFEGQWSPSAKEGQEFSFLTRLSTRQGYNFRFELERLTLEGEPQDPIFDAPAEGRGQYKRKTGDRVDLGGRTISESMLPSYGYPTRQPHPLLADFNKEASAWRVFNIIAVHTRVYQPAPARKGLLLHPKGDNLVQVLLSLYNSHPDLFKAVEETVSAAFPGIEKLMPSLNEEGQTLITVRELSQLFTSENVSDGTLRLLGLLSAIYSPASPSVLCIEEPENAIHPHALQILMDVIRSQAEAKKHQFLITTHSPYLVDLVKPEELVIVEKDEKKGTTAKRASKVRGTKEALKSLGLGELWYSGHLGGVPR